MNALDRPIQPDPDAIARHVDLVFGYLEGLAPVRIFPEKGGSPRRSRTPFLPADRSLGAAVAALAEEAAADGMAIYVVPCAVLRPSAGSGDIVETGVILIDLDDGNVDAKRDHLVRHLGEPAMEVASGGVTHDGFRKRHLYWRLSEAASGDGLERVRVVRQMLAEKAGGDSSFASLHQPIRVAGSVHGKHGHRSRCEVLAESDREVELVEFEAAARAMPAMEGVEERCAAVGAGRRGPSAEQLLAARVREGGKDGATRFEALSKVIGWWLRLARLGRHSVDEAWEAVREYNAARLEPPWDEKRLRREFDALLRLDMKNNVEEWVRRAGASAADLRDAEVGAGEGAGAEGPAPADLSEDALAAVFTNQHAAEWRYVAAWKSWMRWNGLRWRADETNAVMESVRRTCRLAETLGAKAAEARRIGSDKTIRAVERIARTDPRHATHVEAWDADPMLLNTPGGVVDLATGEVLPHVQKRLITRITSVAPGGRCPLWLGFINVITGGDHELAAYLQRLAGLCLTGDVSDQAFFFAHGGGANGKSVFILTLAHVLGDYAVTAPLDAFMASKGDRNSEDLAALRGARLVSVTETEPGRAWAEARIKQITGGDRIRARYLYGHYFEYDPSFKLIIAGNHRPAFAGISVAMRRRLHLIPFEVTIPPEERDRRLGEKLAGEAEGILAWMLEGCAEWSRIGLAPPARVREASDEYFDDEDHVAGWIHDDCAVGEGRRALSSALFDSWSRWAERTGVARGTQSSLRDALKARGFERWRSGRGRGWKGIAPRTGPQRVDEEDAR